MTTEFDPKTPRTDGKEAMEGNDEVPSGLGSRMYWLFNMSQPEQKPETPKVVDGRDEIASSSEARADSGRETLETDGTDDAWIAGNEVGKEKIAKQEPGRNNGSDDCGPEALEADILQRIETMRADIEKLTAVVKAQEDCCEYEDEENASRNNQCDEKLSPRYILVYRIQCFDTFLCFRILGGSVPDLFPCSPDYWYTAR